MVIPIIQRTPRRIEHGQCAALFTCSGSSSFAPTPQPRSHPLSNHNRPRHTPPLPGWPPAYADKANVLSGPSRRIALHASGSCLLAELQPNSFLLKLTAARFPPRRLVRRRPTVHPSYDLAGSTSTFFAPPSLDHQFGPGLTCSPNSTGDLTWTPLVRNRLELVPPVPLDRILEHVHAVAGRQ